MLATVNSVLPTDQSIGRENTPNTVVSFPNSYRLHHIGGPPQAGTPDGAPPNI